MILVDHPGFEVLLLTPPLMDAVEFPELGMPQLLGFLRSHGVRSAQADLNMELLTGFLADQQWRLKVLNGLKRPDQRGPGDGLELILPKRLPTTRQDGIEMLRRWLDAAVPLLELRCPDLSLDGVKRAAAASHPVYEAFYQQRVFGRFAAPRLVGMSLISPSQLHPAVVLADRIRQLWPETFVVVGGPWVNAAERILGSFLREFPSIDAAITRRGERPLLELLSALRQSGTRQPSLGEVPNLLYVEGSKVERTAVASPVPLGSLPPPDFDGLVLPSYPAEMLPLQTNSRCYWGECLFCYHDSPQTSAGERSPAQSADDIALLVSKTGNESFFLADCATPVPWMARFADELKGRALSVRWAAMCRAERAFTPEICQKLSDSGCAVLMIGLETVAREGLARIRKGILPEDVEHAARCCSQAGIRVHLFVLDFPTNTLAQLRETMEFVLRISPWVEDFTVQRFQLSMLSRIYENPALLGIHAEGQEGLHLDVFDLPYRADAQTTLQEFRSVAAEFRRRFDELKGRVGSPFVVASAGQQGSAPEGISEK